jgi:cathepsin X
MSDRIKIMRNASWPDINIAPQVLISCEKWDEGCNGGEPMLAYQWIHEHNITDETCSVYRARGWTNGYDCAPTTFCKQCLPHEPCFVPDWYYTYTVSEFGGAIGEEAMM